MRPVLLWCHGQTSSRPSFQHNLRTFLTGFLLTRGFLTGTGLITGGTGAAMAGCTGATLLSAGSGLDAGAGSGAGSGEASGISAVAGVGAGAGV